MVWFSLTWSRSLLMDETLLLTFLHLKPIIKKSQRNRVLSIKSEGATDLTPLVTGCSIMCSTAHPHVVQRQNSLVIFRFKLFYICLIQTVIFAHFCYTPHNLVLKKLLSYTTISCGCTWEWRDLQSWTLLYLGTGKRGRAYRTNMCTWLRLSSLLYRLQM